MHNFKLNADAFNLETPNIIKISLAGILADIKIIDAVVSVKVHSLTGNSKISINYSPIISNHSSKGWGNVDTAPVSTNEILKINISDELQDALLKKATHLQLTFATHTITFAKDFENDFVNINYILLADFQHKGSSHKISLGKSGYACIDLVTGGLSTTTPIIAKTSNVLPLSAKYQSILNARLPQDTGMPRHWHFNVSQFLIKEKSLDGSLKFTYIDENGTNQVIKTKYYCSDYKKYVERKNLTVDLDGNYLYECKKVQAELTSPSGIKLVPLNADPNLANYESKQFYKLKNQFSLYKTQLHEQNNYEAQVPAYYLYSGNLMYAFSSTLDCNGNETDVYRLIQVSDSYKNSIFISYETSSSNRIKSINNSAHKSIKFVYDSATQYLKAIIDAQENKTIFKIRKSVVSAISTNTHTTLFTYKQNSLQSIFSCSGIGAKFSYLNNQVCEVTPISILGNSHRISKYNFKIKKYMNCLINEEKINFLYNNYKSTSILNAKHQVVTYLFDKYGKVRSTYQYAYTSDYSHFSPEEYSPKVVIFRYENSNLTFKASPLEYSTNFLENSRFSAISLVQTKEMTILDKSLHDNDCANIHKMPKSKDAISVTVKEEMLKQINNLSCKALMLSGWAKANSAFIITDENPKDYPDYIKNRKFELRAEITYADGTLDCPALQFDWRNTDWQYCALPIILKDKEISKLECVIDYSLNTNKDELVFTNLDLKECGYQKFEYNSNNLPIKQTPSHSTWETFYDYDQNNNLISKTVVDKQTLEHYVTTYEYNKQGKLVKTKNYDGTIKENVYTNTGSLIKSLIYHQTEPYNVICNRSILDGNNETYSVSNLTEPYSYPQIDGTDIKTYFPNQKDKPILLGYDDNNASTHATLAVNSEANDCSLNTPTCLARNNFSVQFAYNGTVRNMKITVGEKEYLSKAFKGNEEITSFATGESYKQVLNNDGKVLDLYYKAHKKDNYSLIIQNIYDIYGNLAYQKHIANNQESLQACYYNKFGKLSLQRSTQHNLPVCVSHKFDDNCLNIIQTHISFDTSNLDYAYFYSHYPSPKLLYISSPLGNETISYDKLGLVKKIDFSHTQKEYFYFSNGIYTSNLISKLTFTTNGLITNNLSYKYDKKGNIVEIRQFNQLAFRYKYDSLSRLVREDNKQFNTTTVFEYDIGGNISCKQIYNFTLTNTLNYKKKIKVFPYSYSNSNWKDQLTCYNGESIEYDALGNPIKYRGNNLKWSHVRQLDKFNNIEFKYGANGVRTTKIANGIITKYYFDGTKLLAQNNGNWLIFFYGSEGVWGFKYNSFNYYYKKNIFGDIIAILDQNGLEIAKYSYDAGGNHKIFALINNQFVDISLEQSCSNGEPSSKLIAQLNPFRYRGYYYDIETGLYYTNCRYYDPETCRFINADVISILNNSKNLNELNCYAYFGKNPIKPQLCPL